MKLGTLLAPLLIASLLFIFVWAMGMMVVKSSALATQSSIELLRLQMEVTRMQNLLQQNAAQSLAIELDGLKVQTPVSSGKKSHETSQPLQKRESS